MTNEAINELKKYTLGKRNTEKVEISVLQINRVIKALEQEPSGDLIQRQAVIDAVSEWLYDKTRKESIETVIKTIPSAEPKIGHWVLGICDTCGYDWGKDAPIASVPNFCPNCGCRMFEPQERSDE